MALSSTRSRLEKTNEENSGLSSESEAFHIELRDLRDAIREHDTLLEEAQQELVEQQADTALTLEAKEKANLDLQVELRTKDEELPASQHRCRLMAGNLESFRVDLKTENEQRSNIEAELSSI